MAFRAAKKRFSAAWFWRVALTMLGLGSSIAGIDHGFFEISGLPRYAIQRVDWIVVGVALLRLADDDGHAVFRAFGE